MSKGRLGQIITERKEKIKDLRSMGINPYPAQSSRDEKIERVVEEFDKFDGERLGLVGRLVGWREHGKVVSGDLMDETGKLQLFIKEGAMGKTRAEEGFLGFEDLRLVDVGDFVQVRGEIVKTQTGEISLLVEDLKILSKSLRPLPEKWEGIKDSETRMRKRYLDLLMDEEKRDRFVRKAKFWQANQRFLEDRGFIKVEVPVLEHVTGGADARPFETHMNALDEEFYLRISTELKQKRLLAAGMEKIYTLGPNFRNEGIDDEHLPEYHQVEWYWAYADYKDNMDFVKEMFRYIAEEVYGKTSFKTRGHEFDLSDEWEEIDYVKVIKEKLGVDIWKDDDEKMLGVINEHGVDLSEGQINKNRLVDNLWKIIRKDISGPAFLVNVPKFMSPLAKEKSDDEKLTERFQVVIAGSELGNGYSELNDPVDQRERFEDQQKKREEGDEEAQMMDEGFVEMLEYGMPPASGWGHSERLFWYLEDVSAKEGVLFVPLKRKES